MLPVPPLLPRVWSPPALDAHVPLGGEAKAAEAQARLDATFVGAAEARAEREAAQREPEAEAAAAGRETPTSPAGEASIAEAQARLDAALVGAAAARAEREAAQREPEAEAGAAGRKKPTARAGEASTVSSGEMLARWEAEPARQPSEAYFLKRMDDESCDYVLSEGKKVGSRV